MEFPPGVFFTRKNHGDLLGGWEHLDDSSRNILGISSSEVFRSHHFWSEGVKLPTSDFAMFHWMGLREQDTMVFPMTHEAFLQSFP